MFIQYTFWNFQEDFSENSLCFVQRFFLRFPHFFISRSTTNSQKKKISNISPGNYVKDASTNFSENYSKKSLSMPTKNFSENISDNTSKDAVTDSFEASFKNSSKYP